MAGAEGRAGVRLGSSDLGGSNGHRPHERIGRMVASHSFQTWKEVRPAMRVGAVTATVLLDEPGSAKTMVLGNPYLEENKKAQGRNNTSTPVWVEKRAETSDFIRQHIVGQPLRGCAVIGPYRIGATRIPTWKCKRTRNVTAPMKTWKAATAAMILNRRRHSVRVMASCGGWPT